MKNIGIVIHQNSPAICSSLMMHVKLMRLAGFNPILFIKESVDKSYFKDSPYEMFTYSSMRMLNSLMRENSVNIVWCTTIIYVLVLSPYCIRRQLYLWLQGDEPSESYMRNHSIIRKILLSLIMQFAFLLVNGVIYVSDAMHEYYKKYYRIPNRYIIVPCLSEFPPLLSSKRRKHNSFVYIGGLAVWQCIDETLSLYKTLRTPDSVFHIITRDLDLAKEKVFSVIGDFNNIEIYSINDRNRIPDILSEFEYGFLLRKENTVNHVSSPIKFLEYISCGVNVIMTAAVPSYAKIVKENGIGTIVDIKHLDRTLLIPFSDAAGRVYSSLFSIPRYASIYRDFLENNEFKIH